MIKNKIVSSNEIVKKGHTAFPKIPFNKKNVTAPPPNLRVENYLQRIGCKKAGNFIATKIPGYSRFYKRSYRLNNMTIEGLKKEKKDRVRHGIADLSVMGVSTSIGMSFFFNNISIDIWDITIGGSLVINGVVHGLLIIPQVYNYLRTDRIIQHKTRQKTY